MAGIPPRSRSSSVSGSITCPVHPIACPSLVWPRPRPCLPASTDDFSSSKTWLSCEAPGQSEEEDLWAPELELWVPPRKPSVVGAAGGRAPVRLTGEPARSWQGFGGFGLSRRDPRAAVSPEEQASNPGGETMNKKSIAPSVSGVYVRPASRQVDDEAILLRS